MVLIYRKNRWNKTVFQNKKSRSRLFFCAPDKKGVGENVGRALPAPFLSFFSHKSLTSGKNYGKILTCKGIDGEKSRVCFSESLRAVRADKQTAISAPEPRATSATYDRVKVFELNSRWYRAYAPLLMRGCFIF